MRRHASKTAAGRKMSAVAHKMRVRLYWQDGRVEQLKGEVDSGTMLIVRPTPEGQRRFAFAEEIDDEGYAIFWQEDDEQS